MLPPAAVLLTLVTVNAPLLVKLIFPPPLLLAVKRPTVFAELSVVPPTELVVNVPLVFIAALCVIAPALAVKDTEPFNVQAPGSKFPLAWVIERPVKPEPTVPPVLFKLLATVREPVPPKVPPLMVRSVM